MALETIINGDSLLRDGYFSVVVEWRSARTLRMFVDAVRVLVTDGFVLFRRAAPLGQQERQGHRLWDKRFIDSVKVQAMDASHVSLVMAQMDTVAFMDRPRVYTPDTETSIGVNLNQLAKALRCADDGDRVVLLSDSDPRVGRIYIYIYRPNSSCPEDQSFFKHLYDEGSFMDCFHNGDPNRRLRVRLKKRDVPADQLPTKEMVFDLPKVFVDEPAIGVPPTPPGYTMRIPSKVFRDITSHLMTLADTLDISLFLEQAPNLDNLDDLPDVDPDLAIKIRHKVVFSSTYDVDYNGRHELRSKLRWAGIEKVLDLTEGASDDAICVAGAELGRDESDDSDDEACDIEPEEKPTPLLLITQSFAARYLSTFAAAEEINGVVELYMNEDAPIQVRYVQDGLKMVYFLAPKIDE